MTDRLKDLLDERDRVRQALSELAVARSFADSTKRPSGAAALQKRLSVLEARIEAIILAEELERQSDS